MEIKIKQQLAKYWFSILQDIICLEVENLEKEYGSNIKFKNNNQHQYKNDHEAGTH
mgnify:CR=1 FL=1